MDADGAPRVSVARIYAGECKHERISPRYKKNASGKTCVFGQCLDCGSSRGTMSRASVVGIPQWWDHALEKSGGWGSDLQRLFFEKARASYEDQRRAQHREHLRELSTYYQTETWRKKSRAVVARDGVCRACLVRPATQAHHLTYKHLKDEPLFDLVGVCEPCHRKITAMDRERNGLL